MSPAVRSLSPLSGALAALCLLCLMQPSASGQGSVEVGAGFTSAGITPEWLRDPDHSLSAETLGSGQAAGFQPAKSPFLTFGTDQAQYWLRFTLNNTTPDTRTLVLRLNRKNIGSFGLWRLKPGVAPEFLGRTGTTQPHDGRFVLTDGYHYEIALAPGENAFLAASSNHIGSMYLNLSLHTPGDFDALGRQNIVLLGVFLGVMLLSFIFSLILFVQNRDMVYLLYCLYIVNILVRELYNYSADFGMLTHIGHQCISSLIAATYGMFLLRFISLGELAPRWNRIVKTYIAGIFAVVVLIRVFEALGKKELLQTLFTLVNVFFILFTLNALYLSLRLYRVSERARLAFWAFIPLSLAFVAILLRNLALIPAHPMIQHAVVVGFIFEVIVFTIGFSLWHRSVETDRGLLQMKLAMEMQEKQLAVQAAEQRVKDQIARDLHDDVAASMSGIRILSQVAYTQLKDRVPDTASLLEQISRNAQSTLDSISDLIWAAKPHPDYLNDMADRMREYAVKVLDAKDIAYQMDIPRNLPVRSLDIVTRRNVYLIYKEAVNNALKYSNCRRMEISLQLKDNRLTLRVADDGMGFDPAAIRQGNGLLNMRKRAADIAAEFRIASEPGKGTEVLVEAGL